MQNSEFGKDHLGREEVPGKLVIFTFLRKPTGPSKTCTKGKSDLIIEQSCVFNPEREGLGDVYEGHHFSAVRELNIAGGPRKNTQHSLTN